MLLALDLGTKIGWVLGNPVGPMAHGVISVPETTDVGMWLAHCDEDLRKVMKGATAIAMEQPFLGSDYYPARKLLSQLGHVYYFAHHYGLGKNDIKEIPISTGKLTLAGHGQADKSQMIAAAEQRTGMTGWTEHDADALGIWWTWQFGAAAPIRKPRSRSDKGRSVKGG